MNFLRSAVQFAVLTVLVATSACVTVDREIWILDNADPDFKNAPFEDSLTMIGGKGATEFCRKELNIAQTIGGQRAIDVSPEGTYALVCENVTRQISRFDRDGNRAWTLNRPIHAVDVFSPQRAYGLTESGTIWGESLVEIDTVSGHVRREIQEAGGFDLCVDPARKRIWVVGSEIYLVSFSGDVLFTIDPIAWCAVSVDYRSDGSAWVAVGYHPQVGGSNDRLLLVSETGSILKEVDLDFDPDCVRCDRRDDSVWVALGPVLRKYDGAGVLRLEVPSSGYSCALDESDGSIWVTVDKKPLLRRGTIEHWSASGKYLGSLSGFSLDQKYVAVGAALGE